MKNAGFQAVLFGPRKRNGPAEPARHLVSGFVFYAIGVRIEEIFRLQGVFVNAVDGVGRGQALALRLPLGVIGRAGTVDFDGDLDFGVQVQHDLVQADRLDRRVELDLVATDVEAFGDQRLEDVTGSDRTVELAGFASGADDDEGLAVERVGNGLGFRLAL